MANRSARGNRIRNIAARMQRIKQAVLVTDSLLDNYFERRATEIETFNEELETTLTVPADETPVKLVASRKAPATGKKTARRRKTA